MTDLTSDHSYTPGQPASPGLNGEHPSFADAKDKAEQAEASLIAAIRDALDSRTQEARRWAADRAEVAREAVQERPATAILGALGVGMILGLLASR